MSPDGAIILFAHGARDPRWAQPFEAIARAVQASCPNQLVRLAFLEFMSPGLTEAAAQVIARGARRVEVVPLFLGAGGHVRKDLPQLMQSLAQSHPSVHFALQDAIGEREAVIRAMAASVVASVAASTAVAPQPPAAAPDSAVPASSAHGQPTPPEHTP